MVALAELKGSVFVGVSTNDFVGVAAIEPVENVDISSAVAIMRAIRESLIALSADRGN